MKKITFEEAWKRFKRTKSYKESTAKTVGMAFIRYLFRYYSIKTFTSNELTQCQHNN